MSDLLQIGAKSYTRWESGRARISRSMNVLLSALRDGAVTVEYLRCLRDGGDWLPQMHRRLQNSIIFSCDESADPKSSELWQQVAAALAAGTMSQRELILKDYSPIRLDWGRTNRVFDHSPAWAETSDAA